MVPYDFFRYLYCYFTLLLLYLCLLFSKDSSFPISPIEHLYPVIPLSAAPNTSMLVMIPFYCPDFCRTSIYECLRMWNQAPLMREIMLCLSGSCLLHSIWSFLIPFIYLQSSLFHFYSKLLFYALYIQYFYCWVLWAYSGSYSRLIFSFWDLSVLIFILTRPSCNPNNSE